MKGRLLYIGIPLLATVALLYYVFGVLPAEPGGRVNTPASSRSPVASGSFAGGDQRQTNGVSRSVEVDATTEIREISPLIYGVSRSEGAMPMFTELGVSAVRWGGNARTRFNWEIDATNLASDFEFRNSSRVEGDLPAGQAALDFHESNKAVGAESLLSIPMIGWVARDDDLETRSVNVPSRGGDEGYDPSQNRAATSLPSYPRKSGTASYPPNLTDEAVYQDEWVKYLVRSLGASDAGGIRFYEMDNEPMLWMETHRDVRPEPVGRDEYLGLFDAYAAALKDADASAQVFAPSVWGWSTYFETSAEITGRESGGEEPFLPWFLDVASEIERETGRRLLDYLSIHYYPEGDVYSDDVSPEMRARRLMSTRSLWDAQYTDDSWISRDENGPYVNLIPRMREWIDDNYPGTKLAITEWNWGANDDISGGLAAADVLGIFGREGVDFATIWGRPEEGSPVYWAFRMFRNYDGNGAAFGDTVIRVDSDQSGILSVYASVDSTDDLIKLLMINKSPDTTITLNAIVRGVVPYADVKSYVYGAHTPEGIVEQPPVELNGTRLKQVLAPYSMTLVTMARSAR